MADDFESDREQVVGMWKAAAREAMTPSAATQWEAVSLTGDEVHRFKVDQSGVWRSTDGGYDYELIEIDDAETVYDGEATWVRLKGAGFLGTTANYRIMGPDENGWDFIRRRDAAKENASASSIAGEVTSRVFDNLVDGVGSKIWKRFVAKRGKDSIVGKLDRLGSASSDQSSHVRDFVAAITPHLRGTA